MPLTCNFSSNTSISLVTSSPESSLLIIPSSQRSKSFAIIMNTLLSSSFRLSDLSITSTHSLLSCFSLDSLCFFFCEWNISFRASTDVPWRFTSTWRIWKQKNSSWFHCRNSKVLPPPKAFSFWRNSGQKSAENEGKVSWKRAQSASGFPLP